MVSNNPASLLLDAYNDNDSQNDIQSKSYKTIEIVENLGSNLEDAINNLIVAASHEWDINLQQVLLKV
ncbi:LOW QUALITY PROTEIN: hypothetical protein HZS_4500 [Henneguya salminicola]|nr:LOW QUALITY PROTEIN: hypothetical protein HZS_4500 [Henneguya salminicola]